DDRVLSTHGKLIDDFAKIENRLSILESVDREHLSEYQDQAYARMLGDAIERALVGRSSPAAFEMLEAADANIRQRNQHEAGRQWYVGASAELTLLLSLVALLLLLIRSVATTHEMISVLEGAVATLAGGLGAFLSILQRIGTTPLDVSADKRTYQM